MGVTITYGDCGKRKANARTIRRMKRRAAEQSDGQYVQPVDKVEKAIRFANEERCKSNSVKERRKGATKWYAENESGNYYHATQPRQLGEKPLDKVRYH